MGNAGEKGCFVVWCCYGGKFERRIGMTMIIEHDVSQRSSELHLDFLRGSCPALYPNPTIFCGMALLKTGL